MSSIVITSALSAAASVCNGSASTVIPSNPSDARKFQQWVEAHHDQVFDLTKSSIQKNSQLYQVNLDNGGREETVAAAYAGSGNYLSLFVFSRDGGAYRWITDAPPLPAGEKARGGGLVRARVLQQADRQI